MSIQNIATLTWQALNGATVKIYRDTRTGELIGRASNKKPLKAWALLFTTTKPLSAEEIERRIESC